jgi:predicted MFS family arabinose efflux permease
LPIDEIDQIELAACPTHAERKRRRGMLFLGIACAAMGFAFQLQIGLNDNFVVGELHVSGFEKGLLEAVRETCGITALGLLALLAGLAEPLIGAAMLLLVGIGLATYAAVPNFFWLAAISVVWSQGLHVWMPLPNSMMLSLAEKGRTGKRLGQLQAAGATGGAAALMLALFLTLEEVRIRPIYLLAGGAALAAALACLGIPRDIKTPGPRLVVRRKYGLYYMLCFLEGWRKQIAMAFAGFLLVQVHGMPLTAMLLLWLAINVASWAASPMIGELIDHVGERTTLILYYTSLTGVFVGYLFARNHLVISGLFLADNTLFCLGMALTTYVKRLAPPEEHTPTLSMGVAMNHVAAVSMPLIGGFIWKYLGYQWVFGMGAAVAAASILAVSLLPGRGPRPVPQQATRASAEG